MGPIIKQNGASAADAVERPRMRNFGLAQKPGQQRNPVPFLYCFIK
jgi:hypothetical protein